VPKTFTPEPDLGADFSDPVIPGWQIVKRERVERHVQTRPGPPPHLWASFPSSDLLHYVLQSSGLFEDFDAGVTIKFLSGNLEYISAALVLRYVTSLGGYLVLISAQGTYKIGWYEMSTKDELEWKACLDWTAHSALRQGLQVPNRLRVVMKGNQMRVYLNGVLATSWRDDRFISGQVRLGVEPGEKSSIEAVFSNLELREVPAG
jgi:hypothetical protein